MKYSDIQQLPGKMHFTQFSSQRSQSVCLLLYVSSHSALLFCFSFPKKAEYCQGILILTHLVLSRDTACFGSYTVFLRNINQGLDVLTGAGTKLWSVFTGRTIIFSLSSLSQFLSSEWLFRDPRTVLLSRTLHYTTAESPASVGRAVLELNW